MRALTVRQPYAHDIMTGDKPIEYRSWPTHHRGALLIHSSTKTCDLHAGWSRKKYLLGVILGTVELVDCQGSAGDWDWHLENPRPFRSPIPHKGQVGLWTARLPCNCEHCQALQDCDLLETSRVCVRCGKRFNLDLFAVVQSPRSDLKKIDARVKTAAVQEALLPDDPPIIVELPPSSRPYARRLLAMKANDLYLAAQKAAAATAPGRKATARKAPQAAPTVAQRPAPVQEAPAPTRSRQAKDAPLKAPAAAPSCNHPINQRLVVQGESYCFVCHRVV